MNYDRSNSDSEEDECLLTPVQVVIGDTTTAFDGIGMLKVEATVVSDDHAVPADAVPVGAATLASSAVDDRTRRR